MAKGQMRVACLCFLEVGCIKYWRASTREEASVGRGMVGDICDLFSHRIFLLVSGAGTPAKEKSFTWGMEIQKSFGLLLMHR